MSGHPQPGLLVALGELEAGERERILAHLCECAACRAVLIAREPSALFAVLATQAPPQEILEQVSAGVAAELRPSAPSRPSWLAGRPAWLAGGGLAAALVLAALLGFRLAGPPTPASLAARTGSPATGAPVAAGGGAATARATTAEVFNLTVGDTEVVMIFDEGLEL